MIYKLKAIVHNTDLHSDASGWIEFCNPLQMLVAKDLDDVVNVLEKVDAESRKGRYCIGFVSYEAAPAFDKHLVCQPPGSIPLTAFGVFEASQRISLPSQSPVGLELEPELNINQFDSAISRIKQYLVDGDTYQVNFTHRLKGSPPADIRSLFARLVRTQPTPYAALMEFPDFSICSISPELFFEKTGQRIRTEPMKGTRPRGLTELEDRNYEEELRCSEKDRAENLMIVDMIRNDLARLAKLGTVCVDDLFVIKKLPTVWQQVSNISALTDVGLVDVFRALFPCASVTGAPRHRTMEIIAELEGSPRGVYTGALGLVMPGGDARFSVGIRTLVVEDEAVYGVGGGIVWDSEASDEWQESLLKSDVLRQDRPDFQLLETMRYEPGEGISLLDEHLQRLTRTAAYFDYECDPGSVRDYLSEFTAKRARRLRLLLCSDGTLKLEEHELAPSLDKVILKLADTPVDSRDIFLFHKTTNRMVYDSKYKSDCDDVILFNERGEITETTISNLFLEIDGELLTPDLSAGLLAGTFRQHLLDSGRARTACLRIEDLQRAQQIFTGNSVRGLIPAVFESD